MMRQNFLQVSKILIAASLVSAVLGSIHAFSIFLEPLEIKFGVSRATASLTYSFGLVFLTTAVLFGPFIYTRLKPATIYLSVSILGATGAILASLADNIGLVWFGYSFLFGIANGLGYGFGLQYAARANPKNAGLAMGVITAAYALGAVLAPYGFELALAVGGFRFSMLSLAAAIFVIGLIAAILMEQSQTRYRDPQTQPISSKLPSARIALIWLSYAAAVFAGLMVIGHAASLSAAAKFIGWAGPSLLACFNLLGSLFSGWLADRVSHRRLLTFLPLLTAISLLALIALPEFTLVLLSLVGFAYGGTITVYPAAISQLFPGDDGPRVYGYVFTAWGAAGLLAPWTAGKIFDVTGDYNAALWIATALAILSGLVALRSFDTQRQFISSSRSNETTKS